MVLLVEVLLGVGILLAVARLALRPQEGLAVAEPDVRPQERADGPLFAEDLVSLHLPLGVGYRKVDVDRLLDRVARQLPRRDQGEPPTPPHGFPPVASEPAEPEQAASAPASQPASVPAEDVPHA
jgi:hypothetical protein